MKWAVGFSFSNAFLKTWQGARIFYICGIKVQIFGDKKDMFSVPYLTAFGFLAYNSLSILKSCGIVSLALKISLNIAGDRLSHVVIYQFQLLNFGYFFDEF